MRSDLFDLISHDGVLMVGCPRTACKCGRNYQTICGSKTKEEGDDIPDEQFSPSEEESIKKFLAYLQNHTGLVPIYRSLPEIIIMGSDLGKKSIYDPKEETDKYVVRTRLCWCGNDTE